MEPSKIFGCKEEYSSSSVSGWTMYIGSPVHEADCDDGDEHDHTSYNEGHNYSKDNLGFEYNDANDDSDDSMASDASSGPSNRELSWGSKRSPFDKHAPGNLSSKEKLHCEEKKKERRIKVERDESVLKAKAASPQARSRGKVRKTN
ncbi:protein SOB FIVE-LIKE 1-like [Mangifera indica]|uniref:protein SOB FIVE-LIKE 1-like n=1 Tax=Mangifera indica TaxID=29780 RepID=UPI001CFB1146|nr:protein SOB FIVE-LIKE 1-like [Mangifera indica]XP_044494532.1 protein SOB FIVE-LIKE 1-like [Mangifera indica]